MRLVTALKNDLKFQYRHGFYYAYLVVSLLYIGILSFVPLAVKEFVATLIIFSDPAMLGFFFVGGIILLEKDQNVLESIFVTPFRVREYLLSKVISFVILAVITSLVILISTLGFSFNLILLVIGVVLTSIFFTLLGITLAVRVKSLNGYIIISPLYSIVFVLPLFNYLEIFSSRLFYLLPSQASLILISGAFRGVSGLELVYAVINLSLWIIFAFYWAKSWFYKYVILKVGV